MIQTLDISLSPPPSLINLQLLSLLCLAALFCLLSIYIKFNWHVLRALLLLLELAFRCCFSVVLYWRSLAVNKISISDIIDEGQRINGHLARAMSSSKTFLLKSILICPNVFIGITTPIMIKSRFSYLETNYSYLFGNKSTTDNIVQWLI